MVDAVRTWLDGIGIEPNAFHFEKFSATSTAGVTA
jgi:benzoate/toluate 1,2-dioxygenase reductase subunit